MTGEERRAEILNTMREAGKPVSGAELAKKYQVSRQAIVQDIALLRAANYNVYSTSKGYQLLSAIPRTEIKQVTTTMLTRIFRVSHSDAEMEDELNLIVDNGGKVLDVFVEHSVYGAIHGELNIHCRRQVQSFMEDIRSGKSRPLKNLTSGIHYHTVEADSEETLNIIESELGKKEFLI